MGSASGQALILLRGFHPGPFTPAAKPFLEGIVLQLWYSAQNREGCVSSVQMSPVCIPLLFRVLAHHAQGGPWQGTVSQRQPR